MADISKIVLDGTTYNLKDTTARGKLGLPTGGTAGQVLVKESATDGDAGWYAPGSFPANPNWYRPNGITASNVIAAYKFVGASSKANALKNVVNSSTCQLYTTTAEWDVNTGFYFDKSLYAGIQDWETNTSECTINNSTVAPTIKSVVFGYRYAIAPTSSQSSIGYIGYDKLFFTRVWQGTTNYINYPAIGYRDANTYLYKSAIEYDRGVLGCNYVSTTSYNVYLNGMAISLTAHSTKVNTGSYFGVNILGFQDRDAANKVSAYATAIAFYNVALTAEQHMELYHNIVALGGGLD